MLLLPLPPPLELLLLLLLLKEEEEEKDRRGRDQARLRFCVLGSSSSCVSCAVLVLVLVSLQACRELRRTGDGSGVLAVLLAQRMPFDGMEVGLVVVFVALCLQACDAMLSRGEFVVAVVVVVAAGWRHSTEGRDALVRAPRSMMTGSFYCTASGRPSVA